MSMPAERRKPRPAVDFGPTLYATLIDFRLQPGAEVESIVDNYARTQGTLALAERLTQVLREAYIAGVTDGFTQGVAAECKFRDEHSSE